MNRKTIVLTYEMEVLIKRIGNRIKKARLRRNIKAEVLAEQAGISKGTLVSIEKGSPTVSIAGYAMVLYVLGIEKDLNLIALDEEEKKKYRETDLIQRKRATKAQNKRLEI